MYDDAPKHGDADPQTYARSHPMRIAILRALDGEHKPKLTMRELRAALPKSPSNTQVEYHLGVLRRVGLVRENVEESNAVFHLA